MLYWAYSDFIHGTCCMLHSTHPTRQSQSNLPAIVRLLHLFAVSLDLQHPGGERQTCDKVYAHQSGATGVPKSWMRDAIFLLIWSSKIARVLLSVLLWRIIV